MISIKKTDLIFISKLEIQIRLIAERREEENISYWVLRIKTENKETNMFEEGIFTAYRGEVRQFKNINAMITLLEEVFDKNKVTLEVKI
jgi:hypothetical protein